MNCHGSQEQIKVEIKSGIIEGKVASLQRLNLQHYHLMKHY